MYWSVICSTFLLLSHFQPSSAADCDASTCETTFQPIGPLQGAFCVVDPTDPSYLADEVVICPCSPNQPVYGPITYTGLNGVMTTVPAANNGVLPVQYMSQTATVEWNVPMTAILPGSPVTLAVQIGIPIEATGQLIYVQGQSQSIFYTELTTTILSTSIVETSTTNTQTISEIIVQPQSTTTYPCTTGTITFHAPTPKTTITVTSTPASRTITKNVVKTVTTTLTCLPEATTKQKREFRPRTILAALGPRSSLEERAQIAAYEIPRCDGTPASYVTIVTGTTVETDTATVTDTNTLYTTTTTSSTSTPPGTSVCSNVEGSTTVTPKLSTITNHKVAPRKTTTTTKTVRVTSTKVPKGLPCCSSRKQKAVAHGGPSKPLTTKGH